MSPADEAWVEARALAAAVADLAKAEVTDR